MESNDKMFIFDLDGVIVNTIESLYLAYLNFLNEFNIKGNREEFNSLNGPKIEEIIVYLKDKYRLKPNEEELLHRYNRQIEVTYSNTKLIKGVKEILKKIKEHNFKIALASSSKMKNIETVLKKFEIRSYFDFIVSGDDVKEAKPSPEIYNAVKKKTKSKEYYVIEDSKHGVASAKQANMQVIFFSPEGKESDQDPEYNISKMEEMEKIIKEIGVNCKIITTFEKVKLKLIEHEINLNPEQQEQINSFWNKEKEKNNSLFNGKLISYQDHEFEGNCLTINCFLTEYKYFLAQYKNPELKLDVRPLAVSGIILDSQNNVLIAKRNNVTEYKGWNEFMPSGGINESCIKEDNVFFEEQLKMEFKEETNMPVSTISSIKPFCLIHDKSDDVFDIGCQIILKQSVLNQQINDEYTDQRIIHFSNLEKFFKENKVVPTSLILYDLIK